MNLPGWAGLSELSCQRGSGSVPVCSVQRVGGGLRGTIPVGAGAHAIRHAEPVGGTDVRESYPGGEGDVVLGRRQLDV